MYHSNTMDRDEGQTSSARPNKEVQSNSNTTSASFSGPHCNYDVFLSFRGEDTRKNFIDHLYSALVQLGIRTFRDEEDIRGGKTISTELFNAIRGSKISIVVFSKGYASSRWCLDELVEIVQCRNTIGHTLLPIFYHVDPSDVRKQIGTFAEAFARHEEKFQTDMERVGMWREALTEAANCSGWDLESVANGYESRFVKEIVEEVLCKVNPDRLDVAKHPIGNESRVHHIKDLLNLETSDVRIVGIYGMGGIGKTTLAKAVYNEICDAFEGSSFLSNIKESSEKHGLVHLQEQLLNDILKTNLKIGNGARGICTIKKRIHGKKVLVILDDVDDFENLNLLVKKRWFGPGSRIIVTTRDKHLLSQLGVDEKYKVRELNHQGSIRLFSWHAFKMANPKGDYSQLSNEAVAYAGGNPLALVVLGSFLKGRSIAEWESELEKLQRTPHNKIQKILRISFDSLDSSTKDIFLDIACFFINMDKEYAIKILDGCNFSPGIGISILIQWSLVTIDSQNKLKMHNLIQDMGREIVCEESPKYLGKRSRLWFHKDVLNVLHNHTLFKKLKVLNLSNSKYLTKSPDFSQVPTLEILLLEGCTRLVEIHESIGCLKNLVLLNLKGCKILRNLPSSISNLESLETLVLSKCFNLKKLPKYSGNMSALTVLHMENTAIKELPSSFSLLNNLEILSLRGSKCLIKPPEFLQTSCLKTLILEGCTSLVEVHKSIGLLKRLKELNLGGCKKLRNLPSSISDLQLLETLVLFDCLELDKSAEQLGNMKALISLLPGRTTIEQPPSSLSLLKIPRIISFAGCGGPSSSRKSPKSSNHISLLPSISKLCSLKSLRELNLSGCNLSEDEFPIEFGCLSSLKTLDLSQNNFRNLPNCIKCFPELLQLYLNECTTLQSISLPISVLVLGANGCTSLERILKTNESVVSFSLNNCNKLVEIQSLGPGSKVLMGRCNNLADDFRESVLQMICKAEAKRNRSCVLLPGSEIPNWFSHQTIGSSISFRAPSFWDGKTGNMLLCVVFAANKEAPRDRLGFFQWRLPNKTRNPQMDFVWAVSRDSGFLDSYEDHILVQVMGDLKFIFVQATGDHQIEFEMKSGDEIELFVEGYSIDECEIQVKKCGIHLLLNEPKHLDTSGDEIELYFSKEFLVPAMEWSIPLSELWYVTDDDESDFDTSTDDNEV